MKDKKYRDDKKSQKHYSAQEENSREEVLQLNEALQLELGMIYLDTATLNGIEVDIADVYDHKHQDLSAADSARGLSKMSIDITKAFIRKLATQGEIFDTEKFRTLKATYYRTALNYVEAYGNDARINQLSFDIHQEEQAVELFAENIMTAGNIFLERPMETPFIPSWNRVRSAVPDILERIAQAVEEDTLKYGR